jgi:hypothetical protein
VCGDERAFLHPEQPQPDQDDERIAHDPRFSSTREIHDLHAMGKQETIRQNHHSVRLRAGNRPKGVIEIIDLATSTTGCSVKPKAAAADLVSS